MVHLKSKSVAIVALANCGISISVSFQQLLWLDATIQGLRPLNVSPWCQESGAAPTRSAMQNSCLPPRSLNNKGRETRRLSLRAQRGVRDAANQKHETTLWGTGERRLLPFFLLSLCCWETLSRFGKYLKLKGSVKWKTNFPSCHPVSLSELFSYLLLFLKYNNTKYT